MTLTLRDKCILIILAFALCLYGGYKALWIPAQERIALLEENKSGVEGKAGDVAPLREQTEKLQEEEKELEDSVSNIKKLSGGFTMTNEEFLVFLGKSAKENNVAVSGFNDLGMTKTDGIYRAVFDFELKGNSADINNVLEDIGNIGIKCSYGSLTYRQDEEYDYLKRFFDGFTELPWYTEPNEEDKEEDAIPDEAYEPEIVIEQTIPDYVPVLPETPYAAPEVTVPEEPKQTEPVPEENKPKTIEDRLNELLKQTAAKDTQYKVVWLANTEPIYKEGQKMRLSVTVCFVMYTEPSDETSFLKHAGSEKNEVL